MVLNVRRRRDQPRCRKARVWLNGQEVTKHCFYVDVRRGVVRLFKQNAEGRHYVNMSTGEAATEERRGRVMMRVAHA